MANVLTLYFLGSGHGMTTHTDEDDSMVWAYKKTKGPKALFEGPGGGDKIYYEDIPGKRRTAGVITKAAEGHSITGTGWNRNAYWALRLIATRMRKPVNSSWTINLAGHSRGSITVIMLLNDLFYKNLGNKQIRGYTMAKTGTRGKTKFPSRSKRKFQAWYRNQLEAIWKARLKDSASAGSGSRAIDEILSRMVYIDEINVWMFDPVAGPVQGNTFRKQNFPNHSRIHRVGVLRMEYGGGFLSDNLPQFKGIEMISGDIPTNVTTWPDNTKLVIPLPGSHGAGLSTNKNRTKYQRYIGTSYMLSLLDRCGTRFETGTYPGDWCRDDTLLYCYDRLYQPAKTRMLGSKERKAIHAGTTFTVRGDRKHYKKHALNGHHALLKRLRKLGVLNRARRLPFRTLT